MPKSKVVVLSKENDLSYLVKGVQGSKKYKIITEFIVNLFLDNDIKLSDGRSAIIDKRDAAHIAHKSGDKRIVEVANLKIIIKEAVYFAVDTNVRHNKFDKFIYYKTIVCLDGEIYNIYLNVGRARNNGIYHIYDITRTKRESAHR